MVGIQPRHLGVFLCISVGTEPYILPFVDNGFTTFSGVQGFYIVGTPTLWIYLCYCMHRRFYKVLLLLLLSSNRSLEAILEPFAKFLEICKTPNKCIHESFHGYTWEFHH